MRHVREHLQEIFRQERERSNRKRRAQWRTRLLGRGGVQSQAGSNKTLSQGVGNSADLILRALKSPETQGGATLGIEETFRLLTTEWDGIHQKPVLTCMNRGFRCTDAQKPK